MEGFEEWEEERVSWREEAKFYRFQLRQNSDKCTGKWEVPAVKMIKVLEERNNWSFRTMKALTLVRIILYL